VSDVQPGYKRTEVGVIPADWECRLLGELTEMLTGFPFPSAGFASAGVRLIRGSNVKRDLIDWSDEIARYWPDNSTELGKFRLVSGDIVIAMDGALVGRSFAEIREEHLPALLVQRVARLRSRENSLRYVGFWVKGDAFARHCDERKTHSAIPHISPNDIRSFKVATPPSLPEQQAIAEALADVDALIDALEALSAKKRDIKQGAMQELLTGQRRLKGFQGEWEPKRLEHLGEVLIGLTYSPIDVSADGYIVLRSSNVQEGRLDSTYARSLIGAERRAAAARRVEDRTTNLVGRGKILV
jgi:type I restriction enzyme S subunit